MPLPYMVGEIRDHPRTTMRCEARFKLARKLTGVGRMVVELRDFRDLKLAPAIWKQANDLYITAADVHVKK